MELELGLKLTRVADEFTSDFQIAKDRAGPLFLSRETEAMFILTAHLKGYRRGNIKIDINEDGTLIAISGEKQVKETVMVGWKVYKKETEVKGFKKVFGIPEGVILDKIKAKFSENESTLTITMPKKVKGIKGTALEEIKENHELVKEGSGSLQIVDEKIQTTETEHQEKNEETGQDHTADEMPSDARIDEKEQVEKPVSGYFHSEDGEHEQTQMHQKVTEDQKIADDIQEVTESQLENNNRDAGRANNIHEDEKEGPSTDEQPGKAEEEEEEDKLREKRCKMCIPIVAGSTLLLSFVVFVIHMIRSKNQTGRRRD